MDKTNVCVSSSRVAYSQCWVPSGRPSGTKPVPDGSADSSSVINPNVRYTILGLIFTCQHLFFFIFFCRLQAKARNLGLMLAHMSDDHSVNYQREKRRCQINLYAVCKPETCSIKCVLTGNDIGNDLQKNMI